MSAGFYSTWIRSERFSNMLFSLLYRRVAIYARLESWWAPTEAWSQISRRMLKCTSPFSCSFPPSPGSLNADDWDNDHPQDESTPGFHSAFKQQRLVLHILEKVGLKTAFFCSFFFGTLFHLVLKTPKKPRLCNTLLSQSLQPAQTKAYNLNEISM